MIAKLFDIFKPITPAPAEPPGPYEELFRSLRVLQTERLILRQIEMVDAPALFEMDSDEEICKLSLAEHMKKEADAFEFVRRTHYWQDKGYPTPWGVTVAGEPKLIGTCGVTEVNAHHHTLRLGFAYRRDVWNNGYATEALRCVIGFLFNESPANRIECHCSPSNAASRRVMEKCGMSYEGILREAMVTAYGPFDCCVYSILRREWEASNVGKG